VARVAAASAADSLHEMLGVALALDMDLGRGALDLGEVISGQLDARRAEVLLQ
jgi:hypothetical protein